jgi:hypothetical protein
MLRSLFVGIVALVSTAWFAQEASTRPWYNRYDYYYGPGSQPRASSYYGPNAKGYTLVPLASSNYNPYSKGYMLVPPGSYYYSPPYPPPMEFDVYTPSYQSYGSGWFWFNW